MTEAFIIVVNLFVHFKSTGFGPVLLTSIYEHFFLSTQQRLFTYPCSWISKPVL